MDRLFIASIITGFFFLATIPDISSIIDSVVLLCLAIFTCLFTIGVIASGQEIKWLSNLGNIYIFISVPLSIAFSFVLYDNFTEKEIVENTTRLTLIALSISILSVLIGERKI